MLPASAAIRLPVAAQRALNLVEVGAPMHGAVEEDLAVGDDDSPGEIGRQAFDVSIRRLVGGRLYAMMLV